ncbi:MAG: bifunctional (p)ppGpp synthetase/guanosine-3',5'-bis(diphosphate) 3'-pyrophosphohydrolase [Armatimonadetes bacterium]|nr:MAG: bifunctional (p)ppGpp synthetase/guanosine-3',5'-bis(diphosphate) 3'-pyrophosphohydrolase [Armatimonadota bacterium]
MALPADPIHPEWTEPPELEEFLEHLGPRREEASLERIRKAYFVADRAHKGQTRQTGEPYITHPLAVAKIVEQINMDDDTLVAALLHDTLEDTPVTATEIEAWFGTEVLAMVEGVTKLRFQPKGETATMRARAESVRAAENLRKMLLAMASDVRVVIIKLADRLHNMRTLQGLEPEKRTRIANETLDVFAPLAARLGIWELKWQLEDLAFQNLHPNEYRRVADLVAKSRGERESELELAIETLQRKLAEKGIAGAEIKGRPKHLYSIFQKMVKQGRSFEEIHDLLALRVIVEKVSDCYLALGIVHESFLPIAGLFYDYIAKPKSNGYQSLHTKVMGPHGEPLEVQIRTREMHEVAEYGVAAHWGYKEGSTKDAEVKQLARLREQLFDWSSDAKLSSDFLRSISTDLFSEQVFVFTPRGDVIDLPAGSTPVDFAFRVHTHLGLTVVGAKVNGTMVPLNRQLQNGDVVELITRSNAQPSMDWLEFVRSAHARSKLRSHFRKQSRFQDASRGKDALEREAKSLGLEAKQWITDEKIKSVLPHFDSCEIPEDLYAKVGSGLVSAQNVLNRLRGGQPRPEKERVHPSEAKEGRLTVTHDGVDNILVRRARCCDPVPGDDVVGYTTRGRGMIIHRRICPNAQALSASEPERLVDLDWPPDGKFHSIMLKITTVNRQGLLMDISTVFGEAKANVTWARIRTLPNNTAEIDVSIEVSDTGHLSLVMNRISNYSDVISILRMFGRPAKR